MKREEGRPAKIGTIPMVVKVHGADAKRLAVGAMARIKTDFPAYASRWVTVRVTRVDPDGYFMADLF